MTITATCRGQIHTKSIGSHCSLDFSPNKQKNISHKPTEQKKTTDCLLLLLLLLLVEKPASLRFREKTEKDKEWERERENDRIDQLLEDVVKPQRFPLEEPKLSNVLPFNSHNQRYLFQYNKLQMQKNFSNVREDFYSCKLSEAL